MNKDYPLGLLESYFGIIHELKLDGSNAVILVELEGELDVDLFIKALRYSYERNPLLRASYDKDPDTHDFYFQWDIEFSEIEIKVTDIKDPDLSLGVEALENTLGTLLKPRGPLWRVHLLRDTGEKRLHYLIIGYHHAIIDGVSAFTMTKNIVNYYHALVADVPVHIQSLEKYAPVCTLLSKKISFAQHCINHDRYFEEHGSTKELLYEKCAPLASSKTKVMLCDFSKDVLDKAQVFAKYHDVTINTLFCTTLLRAMYLVEGQNETTIQIPVNLRKCAQPELSEDIVGCYTYGVKVTVKNMSEYNRLELLAQDFQRQFLDNHKIFHMPPLDFPVKEFEKYLKSLAVSEHKGYLWGFGISNWGQVNIIQDTQLLKINAIHRATGRQLGDIPFYFHVATINGEIQGAFNYAVPYMSQQRMAAIVQVFRNLFINVGESW